MNDEPKGDITAVWLEGLTPCSGRLVAYMLSSPLGFVHYFSVYRIQFAMKQPRFSGVLLSVARGDAAWVLKDDITSLLNKQSKASWPKKLNEYFKKRETTTSLHCRSLCIKQTVNNWFFPHFFSSPPTHRHFLKVSLPGQHLEIPSHPSQAVLSAEGVVCGCCTSLLRASSMNILVHELLSDMLPLAHCPYSDHDHLTWVGPAQCTEFRESRGQ